MSAHVVLPRRLVLAGLAGAALTLTGCGIRLEDDAPDIPLVPRRTPVPAEGALLAVLTALVHEVPDDSVPSGSGSGRAAGLRDALERSEVPAAELDAAEAAAPPSTADEVSAYQVALSECAPGLLPLVGGLTFARMLRPGEEAAIWQVPTRDVWSQQDVAARASELTRGAVWAMTVAVAKSDAQGRPAMRRQLLSLQRLQRRQATAGSDDGSGAPLGYELETPVTTTAQAERLALETTSSLVDGFLQLLPDLADDRTDALELLSWATTAQSLGERWGLEADRIPGVQE